MMQSPDEGMTESSFSGNDGIRPIVQQQTGARSFVGCGGEEYRKGDITAPTDPVGLGIHGEVLPEQVSLRLQYGDILQEKATHTGCGGEGYSRGEANTAAQAITPREIPTRGEIIRELRNQYLSPDVQLYVSRLINELAGDGEDADLLSEAMRAQFPEFWGWLGPSSLFGDQSDNKAVQRWKPARKQHTDRRQWRSDR